MYIYIYTYIYIHIYIYTYIYKCESTWKQKMSGRDLGDAEGLIEAEGVEAVAAVAAVDHVPARRRRTTHQAKVLRHPRLLHNVLHISHKMPHTLHNTTHIYHVTCYIYITHIYDIHYPHILRNILWHNIPHILPTYITQQASTHIYCTTSHILHNMIMSPPADDDPHTRQKSCTTQIYYIPIFVRSIYLTHLYKMLFYND